MRNFPVVQPSQISRLADFPYARRGLLVAALCLATFAVRAQSLNYGALEELFGEAVTTSVTGSPQVASDVPAMMEIITADDIRRSGATDIPGVLQHVTGVDVRRWTNSGVDVGIRGYNAAFSPRLLVLVNGRQVYADLYGYTPWSSVPVELETIRQIEIVKGPNSALFGFNAVGGVINIITYNPRYDPLGFATVRGGSQDLVAVAAGSSLHLADGWDMLVSAGVRENADFSTPTGIVNDHLRRGDKRRSLSVESWFALAPAVELQLKATHARTEQANMLPNYVLAFEQVEVSSVRAFLSADLPLGLVQGSLYTNWIDELAYTTFVEGRFEPNSTTPTADYANQVTVAQLQHLSKLGNQHTLRLTAEYREGDLNSSPLAGGLVFYDVAAAGAMWEWQLSEAVTLTNAIRRDRLKLGRHGSLPEGFGLTNAAWDRALGNTSFNSALVWKLGADDTLRFIVARGAQLPSLFSLGGLLSSEFSQGSDVSVGPFIAGIPQLRPVVVTSREIGWDHHLSRLNADLGMTVFRGQSRDVLANFGGALPEAAIISAPANIGNSGTDGIELQVGGMLNESWRWRTGYLYQDVDDEFAAQFPAGRTLRSYAQTTPRHNFNLSLGWTVGSWEADAFVRRVSDTQGISGDRLYLEPPSARVPEVLTDIAAFAALDMRIARALRPGLVVALAGQNLLRSEQRQTSGPMVERRVHATLSWEF